MSPRRRWSLAAPLLVLAGLFGMHGLADHSTGHAAHQVMAMSAHAMEMSDAGDVAVPDPGPAGLCLAVLLGGFVALLLMVALDRRTSWAAPRLLAVDAPAARGRDPDPPTPVLLSVYRC